VRRRDGRPRPSTLAVAPSLSRFVRQGGNFDLFPHSLSTLSSNRIHHIQYRDGSTTNLSIER